MNHPLRFFFGLSFTGISCFGTCTSLRASASNSLNPFGFLAIGNPLLKSHESTSVDLAELPVGDATARNMGHDRIEAGRVVILPGVEPESLLIDVALEVERRDRNISPLEHPLEKRPEVFESVGVNQPAHVFLSMIDGFMDEMSVKPVVGLCLIGEHVGTTGDVLMDDGLQFAGLSRWHDGSANLATTLQKPVNDPLAHGTATPDFLLPFALVHVAGLATDESLIGFDCAGEFAESAGSHGFADSMQHKPRRLLGDIKGAGEFTTADAILGVADAPDGYKPLIQPKGRIFKDRPHLVAELLFISINIIGSLIGYVTPRFVSVTNHNGDKNEDKNK